MHITTAPPFMPCLHGGRDGGRDLWWKMLLWHFLYLDFARVGGFHMQGTSGRSDSELCFALNNAAYGSLRLARRVKIDEK